MKRSACLIAALALLPLAFADGLRIVVSKADRILEVYRGESRIHHFRVGLGNSPVGDKERSGDGRTPEGVFYICVKNPNSRYYLSLGISYPDTEDAARGLSDQLISKAEHDQIVAAQRKKGIPPWNTRLGGDIFIHGRGSTTDWTLGCIALDDANMKMLFDLIQVGTPVEILP